MLQRSCHAICVVACSTMLDDICTKMVLAIMTYMINVTHQCYTWLVVAQHGYQHDIT